MSERPRSIIAGVHVDHPDVRSAGTAAAEARPALRATTPTDRSALLQAVAHEIESDRYSIADTATAESHLPAGRISGELDRTTGQLRMFAEVARRADHLHVRIDPALRERVPFPRPDIRQQMVPIGPVAVFGASNFPLAFSTAGGDTSSALAAGCPVVIKGHPAHPRTGYLVAQAVARAVTKTGQHPGTFSFLLDEGRDSSALGRSLVADPNIRAVGFTGSRSAGLAIAAAAASRPQPIPVYAEMSSINPVVILPGALSGADLAALANAYVASLTLGSGQFCTNPGLLFLPRGEDGDEFLTRAAEVVRDTVGTAMLTPGIAAAYAQGVETLRATDGVRLIAEGSQASDGAPAPQVVETTTLHAPVTDEVFGPSGVVVRYRSVDDLLTQLSALEGQLTVTLHSGLSDTPDAVCLLPLLEEKAGRICFDGWPTGVEVGHAMVHGGPFPASSDSRTTSVGSLAIERFQRPVAYQDAPSALLPAALQDDNPWELVRRIDGELRVP